MPVHFSCESLVFFYLALSANKCFKCCPIKSTRWTEIFSLSKNISKWNVIKLWSILFTKNLKFGNEYIIYWRFKFRKENYPVFDSGALETTLMCKLLKFQRIKKCSIFHFISAMGISILQWLQIIIFVFYCATSCSIQVIKSLNGRR